MILTPISRRPSAIAYSLLERRPVWQRNLRNVTPPPSRSRPAVAATLVTPFPAASAATPMGNRPAAGVVTSFARVVPRDARTDGEHRGAGLRQLEHAGGGDLDRVALGRGIGGDAAHDEGVARGDAARGRGDPDDVAVLEVVLHLRALSRIGCGRPRCARSPLRSAG